MKPGSLMQSQGSPATTVMNRMLKATHKVKTTGSLRKKSAIGGIGKMPASMASAKNPAWVGQGQAKGAATPGSKAGGANLANGRLVFNSDNTRTSPSVANSTPQASLNVPRLNKSAKRKKASKTEMDMAYKGKAKKKASK